MRRKKGLWILLGCWTCAVATGYCLAAYAPTVYRENEQVDQVDIQEMRTAPDCVITTQYAYTLCGHETTVVREIEIDEVGLTCEELEQLLPGSIETFDRKAVTVHRRMELYCAEHVILQEASGGICLQRTEEDAQKVLARLKMRAAELPVALRARIHDGIIFADEDAAQVFLRENNLY